jgi:hypothetical protein
MTDGKTAAKLKTAANAATAGSNRFRFIVFGGTVFY